MSRYVLACVDEPVRVFSRAFVLFVAYVQLQNKWSVLIVCYGKSRLFLDVLQGDHVVLLLENHPCLHSRSRDYWCGVV